MQTNTIDNNKTIYRRVYVHSLIGIYYAETCGKMGKVGGWYIAIIAKLLSI